MPLRSGLMFGGVVPHVGVLGDVRGCRNITAHSVVRAMSRVNARQPYFAPWCSANLERIYLNVGIFDYVHCPTPHAKYGDRRKEMR